MTREEFINKWSPNPFEKPYPHYCFKLDLKEYDKQIEKDILIKFFKHLLAYDTPLTNEDIINEVENWLKEQKGE